MEKQDTTQVLDEYGLPLEWRRDAEDPVSQHYASLARETEAEWDLFELWCEREGLKSIPATAETVVRYLNLLASEDRQSAWDAIDNKYESLYWHTGACPHCQLWIGYGLKIVGDGIITVREDDRSAFVERFG